LNDGTKGEINMTQSIIITGAGRGVGKATAEAFFAAGWRVGLIGRNVDALEGVAKGQENALVLPCDVTDEAAVDAAFDKAVSAWGRIDALFNNAGVSLKGAPIDEMDVNAWRDVIDINVTGSFICARAAFARMRAQDPQGGRIINNGSVSAYVPRWGSAAYTASKHAITGLTRTISLDGRPFSIACGQIDIGNALTDMAQSMTTGMPQADGSIKVEAVMDVKHVADSVVHMAALPLDANVQFMTVMATNMPYIGRG
jgi:NAD(P)-dependent dehydrogenase (short-subunit alcohol dehydrogenase family)